MAEGKTFQGTQGRIYEAAFLCAIEGILDTVRDMISHSGAEILYVHPASQIAFAYPIKKQTNGYFSFIQFRAGNDILQRIKEALTTNRDLLRFLLIKDPTLKVGALGSEKKEGAPRETPPQHGGETRAVPLTNEALEAKLEEILK